MTVIFDKKNIKKKYDKIFNNNDIEDLLIENIIDLDIEDFDIRKTLLAYAYVIDYQNFSKITKIIFTVHTNIIINEISYFNINLIEIIKIIIKNTFIIDGLKKITDEEIYEKYLRMSITLMFYQIVDTFCTDI